MAKKIILLNCGWIALALGVLGIFLPLLPTTPFVLLASWCFARSSRRFHHWLTSHATLGPIISRWESGQGITPQVRNRALGVMWLTMVASMIMIGQWWAVALLSSLGMVGSGCLIRWSKMGENADTNPAVCPLRQTNSVNANQSNLF